MFKTRVLTACVLLPLLLSALFYLPTPYWALFCAVLLAFAGWEWQRLSGMTGILARSYPALIAAIFLAAWFYLEPQLKIGILFASSLFWIFAVPLWLKAKWPLQRAGNMNALLGVALLVPAAMAMVFLRQDGWPLLAIMAVAWVADTFAYFTGKACGKNKLAPNISPGKSWEGVAGGAIAVVLYIQLLPKPFLLLSQQEWWRQPMKQSILWLLVALLLTAVSVMGDLLESLFKRQAAIKDSSNLLPGHGGVLDRIDSLLAILPVSAAIYLLAQLF